MRYEDIGKSPEEIRETLDANNRLISQYAEENERLKRQIEAIRAAGKAVHNAVIALDVELNL